MKTFTGDIIENPDNPEELLLEFPQELLEIVGWKEGTVLNWKVKDGAVHLTVANKQQPVVSDE